MHHPQNSGKRSFSGSLTRRLVFVVLIVLVIPLFIHTLLLYREEILIEEQDARNTLKALGAQIVQRIESQIEWDWELLALATPPFKFETISVPPGIQGNFAHLNRTGTRLFVGKVVQAGSAHIFSHPLDQLLSIPDAPFPIHASINKSYPPTDHVAEQFPIPGTSLALTLSTSWELIADLQTSRWIFRICTFLALVFVVGGGLLALFARKFSRSLDTLRGTMERVADGAVHSRFTPQRFGFEINAIGLALNETLESLLRQEEIARKEGAERERLAEELALGRKIQNDLLPSHIPSLHGLEVSSGYLAAKEVSGDFYDLFSCKAALHERILIVVADLAGKGIGACLHAIGLRSTLRAFASSGADLKQIVRQTEELFLKDAADSGLFATMWIGLLSNNKLSYLSLGHPPALLKRNGAITELSTGDPSLGILEGARLEEGTLTLQPGDELLLYTDGAIEAMDPEGHLFGHGRLEEVFSKASSAQQVLDAIELFSASAAQHDDLTLLFIRH